MRNRLVAGLLTVLLGIPGCWYDEDAYKERYDELADSDMDNFFFDADPRDCDDQNGDINPLAMDVPGDGIDQNCDGFDDCFVDKDFDGYGRDEVITGTSMDCDDRTGISSNADDCDDDENDVNPGATEVPEDGIDQDCDSSTPS